MGKGSNASKNARARADKLKREGQKKAGGGGASGMAARSGTASTKRICQICRSQFMMTQNRDQLMTHVSSKHSASDFDRCFPDFGKEPAAAAAGAGAGGGKGKR